MPKLAHQHENDSFKSLGCRPWLLHVALRAAEPMSRVAVIISTEHKVIKRNKLTADAQRVIAVMQEGQTGIISAAVTGKIDVRGLA